MIRNIVFGFIIIGLIYRVFLYQHVAFYDWDEGFYAVVAKEILANKSLQTTFNGEIWLDKPALSHYQLAGIFALTKNRELYSRMLMTFYGSLTLIFTYLLSKKIMGHFFSVELKSL